ncbi:MAG: glycosyltransferase [Acidobacteriota bacterium]
MRILIALTYYRPHVSGLTMYAQRLAEGLVARGHSVTVLTSHYAQHLPIEECRSGVRVVRVRVVARIGKGVMMPGYSRVARALVAAHDVVLVNYPITPFESDALVCAARHAGVPLVVAYQCDIELPRSFWSRVVQRVIESAGRRLLRASTRILVLSIGYARTSRMLRPHLDACVVQAPPITVCAAGASEVAAFRARHAPDADVVIGVAARIAAEKGIEHLLAARQPLCQALGRVQLLIAGAGREALGERRYWARLAPLIADWGPQVAFVGQLPDAQMAALFGACDVTCLPSVNRTESFGLVQVESMLCGTPVVATDLPGIRDPVARSGMGRLVPPRDCAALATAIADLVGQRAACVRPPEEIRALFATETFAADCERQLVACARARPPETPPETDELTRLVRLHIEAGPPFRALVRAVESLLIRRHVPLARSVLDLGCGDGQFAAITLATPVAYGLDPDQIAIDQARRGGMFADLICGQADRIPLEDRSCGMVLANSVLEHIVELDRPLAEIHRVLVDHGWLVVTAPSHRFAEGFGVAVGLERLGLSACARRYRDWFNRLSRHYHLDSADTWRTRLDAAGFSVTHHEYYLSRSAMFWFDLLHYASAPSLLARWSVGRWHWLGRPVLASTWTAAITRLARRAHDGEGPYVFLLAQKR